MFEGGRRSTVSQPPDLNSKRESFAMDETDCQHGRSNRDVRRRILVHLYEAYSADPLTVLSPKELESGAQIERDELMCNIFYLEERGYVECMKRYGSRLFAAARITPDGIDLVEDSGRIEALFGDRRDRPTMHVAGEMSVDASDTLRRLHLVVYEQDIDTDRRNALLDDLRALEFEAGRPADRRRLTRISALLEWIHEPLADVEPAVREIDLLRALLRSWEEPAG